MLNKTSDRIVDIFFGETITVKLLFARIYQLNIFFIIFQYAVFSNV